MMYVGGSLTHCLYGLINGDIKENDILLVSANTQCIDHKSFMRVVEAEVGAITHTPAAVLTLDQVLEVLSRLYLDGRIHQPRLTRTTDTLMHRPLVPSGWYHLVPVNENRTPAVVEAYNHYRMLDALTK